MAEPGDPHAPDDHDDDLIGFASPASLQGRARAPEPAAEPASPAPAPGPERLPEAAGAPDLFSTFKAPAEPPLETAPRAPEPVQADSIFEAAPPFAPRPARPTAAKPLPGGGMNLYAVYALILFAVPTAGVSALVGLLAVTGRDGPDDPLSQSHFVYQQRTLWAAAVVAAAGVILLAAPFALGVPILFALALWVMVRGATGVWALTSGQPIADPRGWWIRI